MPKDLERIDLGTESQKNEIIKEILAKTETNEEKEKMKIMRGMIDDVKRKSINKGKGGQAWDENKRKR